MQIKFDDIRWMGPAPDPDATLTSKVISGFLPFRHYSWLPSGIPSGLPAEDVLIVVTKEKVRIVDLQSLAETHWFPLTYYASPPADTWDALWLRLNAYHPQGMGDSTSGSVPEAISEHPFSPEVEVFATETCLVVSSIIYDFQGSVPKALSVAQNPVELQPNRASGDLVVREGPWAPEGSSEPGTMIPPEIRREVAHRRSTGSQTWVSDGDAGTSEKFYNLNAGWVVSKDIRGSSPTWVIESKSGALAYRPSNLAPKFPTQVPYVYLGDGYWYGIFADITLDAGGEGNSITDSSTIFQVPLEETPEGIMDTGTPRILEESAPAVFSSGPSVCKPPVFRAEDVILYTDDVVISFDQTIKTATVLNYTHGAYVDIESPSVGTLPVGKITGVKASGDYLCVTIDQSTPTRPAYVLVITDKFCRNVLWQRSSSEPIRDIHDHTLRFGFEVQPGLTASPRPGEIPR